MDMDAALLKPAAGHQAAPRRAAMAAAIRLCLTPAASLFLRVAQLLLAAAVLAVTATMVDELVPHSAIRLVTLAMGSAAVVQVAWAFPLAVLDATAVLGKRRHSRRRMPTYLIIAGDLFAAAATHGAAGVSLGVAHYAATEEGAEWPLTARYITLVAASFAGSGALSASTAVGVVRAAYGSRRGWD